MYQDLAFMNFGKEFQSEDISYGMATISNPILSWGLTLHSWRHINIAIKRKHCGRSMNCLNGEEGDSVHALQSGHSEATERRIYGLTPESILGGTEDVMALFLEASTEWQRLHKIVPGGVSLPYFDTVMSKYSELQEVGLIKTSKFQAPLTQAASSDTGAILNMLKEMSSGLNALQAEMKQVRGDVACTVSSFESWQTTDVDPQS
jgi:hypothetical protein